MTVDAVANLTSAHPVVELIDFSDEVITHYEWWPAGRSLRVEVTPDQRVGVLQARGEHADPHLTLAGIRQGSVDNLQAVGAAEARELNNSIARLAHG
jgi:hypothetical protein